MTAIDDDILAQLAAPARLDLRALCEAMDIRFPSSRRWNRVLVRRMAAVSRAMQRLRRAGVVRFVRAAGLLTGWERCSP